MLSHGCSLCQAPGRQTGVNRKIWSDLLSDIYEPTESWEFTEDVAGFCGLSEYVIEVKQARVVHGQIRPSADHTGRRAALLSEDKQGG